MNISAELALRTLDRVVAATGATERVDQGGGAYLTLQSPMSPEPVGSMRIFAGGSAAKIVYVGMTVPPIGLDSHMIFAFTAAESAVPHFTLDSVQAGDMNAFHLDLVPRCDYGANIGYIDAAFAPLDEAYEQACQIEGLSPAHLSRRQWAVMSPWMLANRATEQAMVEIETTVNAYLDHWLRLLDDGIPEHACPCTGAELAARDTKHRAALFSPKLDPVWNQVDQLLGEPTSHTIQEMLRDNEMPVKT